MFNLFRERPRDVKRTRSILLDFIKEKLQRAEGGEGVNINGLYLYFNCMESERYMYESVLFSNVPGKFKQEVQRIADDYAISLPASWKLEVEFTDKFPAQSYICTEINAALLLSTRKAGIIQKKASAWLKVLNGQAEKDVYRIEPTPEKLNIGREAKAQLSGGFVRKNNIAFVSNGTMDSNRSVSRQHAHIEWEAGSGSFLVFADEGGIPPNNKMKIRSAEGTLIKMQAIEVGHRLQEGDQIILGDTAVLEFTYLGD